MNVVIYVDPDLMIAIAAKLVGILRQDSQSVIGGASLNWLIQGSVSTDRGHSTSRDVRELLPEDVTYLIYDKIENRFTSVDKCIEGMAESGAKQLLPGSVVSVAGVLSFPNLETPNYDPFSPPAIEVPTFSVHGETCFVGRVVKNGFALPVYFPESAKNQVCFCKDEPVEIIGITRWSPPYRPGGSRSLTKIIRAAAVLLR